MNEYLELKQFEMKILIVIFRVSNFFDARLIIVPRSIIQLSEDVRLSIKKSHLIQSE